MEWILFIIFLFLSASYSGSEIAFVASNQLKLLAKSQEEGAHSARKYFIYNPSKFLSTTLVGNNVVMVATSSIAAVLFAPYMSGASQIFFTTAALLLFGEIIPKAVGKQIPNRLANLVRVFITSSYYVFYLLVLAAEAISRVLVAIVGGDKQDVELFFKKADLPVIVREYLSNRSGQANGQELVSRAVRISEKKVYDVMIHRTDIVAAEWDTPVRDLLQLFKETGFSRIPVYEDSIDNIKGVVYFLDLLRPNLRGFKRSVRKAVFIPETVSVVKALKRLRSEQISIAMVIDEHGGIAGMVTIEDLVEELFGAIHDEFDRGQLLVRKQSTTRIIADGKAEVQELNEKYGLDIPEGDYVTIGGYLAGELGRIPLVGDKVILSRATISVTKADQVRVIEVEITLSAGPDDPEIST